MSIIILQHSDHNGGGRIAATLRDHGFKLDFRRPDRFPGDHLRGVPQDLDNVHGVVILGGPQNVTDIGQHTWMQEEVEFIKKAHARHLPVIGICLGSQLIAHSLGGQVAPRPSPTVGMSEISVTVPGQTDTIMAGIAWRHPQLFSCGQEVTQPPAGATILATAPVCKVAAFRIGIRTFGFAFHPECDRPMIDALVAQSGELLKAMNKSAADVTAEVEAEYQTYARLSDRLALNIATFCFPFEAKLTA